VLQLMALTDTRNMPYDTGAVGSTISLVADYGVTVDNVVQLSSQVAAAVRAAAGLTALDCSGDLGTGKHPYGYYLPGEQFDALLAIIAAAPPTLEQLALPDNLGVCCCEGLGFKLGAALGGFPLLRSLRLVHAITASSDATPAFFASLVEDVLPALPALTALSLHACTLHSAEEPGGPTLAALAAAAPALSTLDLTGNLLWRAPLGSVTACLGALPALTALRLGLEETRAVSNEAWSAEKAAAVRAAVPAGCTVE
jgi:hypothetical protein